MSACRGANPECASVAIRGKTHQNARYEHFNPTNSEMSLLTRATYKASFRLRQGGRRCSRLHIGSRNSECPSTPGVSPTTISPSRSSAISRLTIRLGTDPRPRWQCSLDGVRSVQILFTPTSDSSLQGAHGRDAGMAWRPAWREQAGGFRRTKTSPYRAYGKAAHGPARIGGGRLSG